MVNKLLFGYLGVIINIFIVIDVVERLTKDNHLESLRYSGIILYILAGILWTTYGIQNNLVPTTIAALFQLVVFLFIFLLKYNSSFNKDGFTIDRTKI